MSSSSEELREQIALLPNLLRKALEQQGKALIGVARLESRISKLEAEIESEDEDELPASVDSTIEDDLKLLKYESNVERLKLSVIEAEDKAEMAYREITAKSTEGQVKAAVGTDQSVIKLRHEHLDAKDAAREWAIKLQNKKLLARTARIEARYESRADESVQSDKLSALQEQLDVATEELSVATIEVEVLRTTVEIYKMLVSLS